MKRVFELKIDEDDDISGIQYISIVKNPATELEFEVFSDETPHICYKEEDFSDALTSANEYIIYNYYRNQTSDSDAELDL